VCRPQCQWQCPELASHTTRAQLYYSRVPPGTKCQTGPQEGAFALQQKRPPIPDCKAQVLPYRIEGPAFRLVHSTTTDPNFLKSPTACALSARTTSQTRALEILLHHPLNSPVRVCGRREGKTLMFSAALYPPTVNRSARPPLVSPDSGLDGCGRGRRCLPSAWHRRAGKSACSRRSRRSPLLPASG
jgi:hypothetical protein